MAVISENKVDIDFILDWISDWTHGVSCLHKSLYQYQIELSQILF